MTKERCPSESTNLSEMEQSIYCERNLSGSRTGFTHFSPPFSASMRISSPIFYALTNFARTYLSIDEEVGQ